MSGRTRRTWSTSYSCTSELTDRRTGIRRSSTGDGWEGGETGEGRGGGDFGRVDEGTRVELRGRGLSEGSRNSGTTWRRFDCVFDTPFDGPFRMSSHHSDPLPSLPTSRPCRTDYPHPLYRGPHPLTLPRSRWELE